MAEAPLPKSFIKEEKRVKAIEAARARRVARATVRSAKTQWFIDEVSTKVKRSMGQRVRLATHFLQDQIVINISRPVTKNILSHKIIENGKSKWVSRVWVDPASRSKKGEFPKADTTQLMKNVFSFIQTAGNNNGVYAGYVGITLDYGVILETSKRLDRSFMVKTFNLQKQNINKILTGPIK